MASDVGDRRARSLLARRNKSPRDNNNVGMQMELIFVNNNGNDQHAFNIPSSSTLKAVLTEYSTKIGVSLRSLRFFSDNNPLFVSQSGKRTLDELGMTDQNVIVVREPTKQDVKNNGPNNEDSSTSNPVKKKNRANSKNTTKAAKQNAGKDSRGDEIRGKLHQSLLASRNELFLTECMSYDISSSYRSTPKSYRKFTRSYSCNSKRFGSD